MRSTVKALSAVVMVGLVAYLSAQAVLQRSSMHESDRHGAVVLPAAAASQLTWVPFDYPTAWGVPGIDDESVVITIAKVDDGQGGSSRDAGGLQCSGNFQAGMSQLTPNPPVIDPDQPLPPPDLIGTLSDMLIYSIPYIIPDVTYDLANYLDDPSITGTIQYEYIIFSGVLTTPAGYSAPVSGDGVVANIDETSQGGAIFSITTIMIEREWQSLQDARAYIKGFVKENSLIADLVRETGYQPVGSEGGPLDELFDQPGFDLGNFNDCVLAGPGLVCLQDLAEDQEEARNQWADDFAECERDRRDKIELAELIRDQAIALADDINTTEGYAGAGILGATGAVCGLPFFPPFGSGIFGSGGALLGLWAGNAEGRAKLRRLARDQFLVAQRQAEQEYQACYDGAAEGYDDALAQARQDFFDCIDQNCPNLPVP